MNTDIDRFVSLLTPRWKRTACQEILEDIRNSAQLTEHIKWNNPYFELNGVAVLKCYCARDWINIFFYQGHKVVDPLGLFEPTDNARMRVIRVAAGRGIDRAAFRDMVRDAKSLAASTNRRGERYPNNP